MRLRPFPVLSALLPAALLFLAGCGKPTNSSPASNAPASANPATSTMEADLARTGAESNDTEGLIDHIRAIEPVVVACVFEELEPELTRISLRSKSDRVNVNEVAAQFGGGGHLAAAGARIPGKPLAVQRRVIAAVKKAINAAR